MHITIQHDDGQYPSFTIHLHVKEGAEPFLSIKKCKIVSGKNGDFISYPAQKNESTNKWYPYLYGGEKFNAHVMKLAQADKPKPQKPPAKAGSGFDDMDDSIPF
jgi:hypothetical protein